MIDQGSFLCSKPISEIVIGPVDARYVARIWWYLENKLGCKIKYLRGQNQYQITLPAGTEEHTYAGQSTQWTHRTTICFPTGQRLTKYVFVSLSKAEKSTTMLAFTNDVLFGPEPQHVSHPYPPPPDY